MIILQQVEILDRILNVMSASAGNDFEEMTCEFDYYMEDGDSSVGSMFSFVRKGKVHQVELIDDTRDVYRWVRELHGLMTAQTGGDWKKLVLSIDKTGKAKTKFGY